jgi:ABC-2 type transport system permease protein
MQGTLVVFKRELAGYFVTPVAYVVLAMFLLLSGFLTWSLGGYYESNQADMRLFFNYVPWLFLLLIPAISMRLWSEERRSGTIELLLTLPISLGQAVVGKFLAAWAFIGIALALTLTEWISVAYLGEPDHGVIFAGYVGSFVMAGAYLAVGSCVSSLTKNQVVAFVVAVLVCLMFMLAGLPGVIDLAVSILPETLVDVVRDMSFLNHYSDITRGVIDLRDLVYFGSLITLCLFINTALINWLKAR